MTTYRAKFLTMTSALALAAAGCAPMVISGGGSGSSSLQPGARATVGFTATCTKAESTCLEATISGTYHDKGTSDGFPDGVVLTFTGVAHFCSDGVADPCGPGPAAVITQGDDSGSAWWGMVSYRSQVRSKPGTGCALLLGSDSNTNGKPDKGDTVQIAISQGLIDAIAAGVAPIPPLPTDCRVAGAFDGYENITVINGNITIKPLSSRV